VFLAEGAQLLRQLDLPNIIDIGFSPRGTYLSTWERHGELSRPEGTAFPIDLLLVVSFADWLFALLSVIRRFGFVRFACAGKLEDGAQHKNHRVFSVSTGEELIAFTQKGQEGWDLQYTISESHAIRLVGADIQVYRPAEWSHGIVDKLKVEGATSVVLSPGLNPSVAVFVAEKKVRRYLFHTVT
jgi:translation initiation factor 2A